MANRTNLAQPTVPPTKQTQAGPLQDKTVTPPAGTDPSRPHGQVNLELGPDRIQPPTASSIEGCIEVPQDGEGSDSSNQGRQMGSGPNQASKAECLTGQQARQQGQKAIGHPVHHLSVSRRAPVSQQTLHEPTKEAAEKPSDKDADAEVDPPIKAGRPGKGVHVGHKTSIQQAEVPTVSVYLPDTIGPSLAPSPNQAVRDLAQQSNKPVQLPTPIQDEDKGAGATEIVQPTENKVSEAGRPRPQTDTLLPLAPASQSELQQIPVPTKIPALTAEVPVDKSLQMADPQIVRGPTSSVLQDLRTDQPTDAPGLSSTPHMPIFTKDTPHQEVETPVALRGPRTGLDAQMVVIDPIPMPPSEHLQQVGAATAKAVLQEIGTPPMIEDQLANSIKAGLDQYRQQITIDLYPPELGRVVIQIERKEDGIEGRLEVSNRQTLASIHEGIGQLTSNLHSQGIQVRHIELCLNEQMSAFDPSANREGHAQSDPRGQHQTPVQTTQDPGWPLGRQQDRHTSNGLGRTPEGSIDVLV
ncbi:MAG: flagellar hook-length control protein FliK [Sedimentisphaerales bacterium]|nr:flagellar hook-length control protein FliK [Sedimentisphaerales bacterium]